VETILGAPFYDIPTRIIVRQSYLT